jgi:dipeptidyl-peptidase-4
MMHKRPSRGYAAPARCLPSCGRGAGVTDQRLHNKHWRERFVGHPDEFPERYEASSLMLAAPKLIGPLRLIYGLADDNAYPANTLRLS